MTEASISEDMKGRDIILMLIAKGQERAEFGRTSLQKVAYFVGRVLGRDLGHRAHFYGPFASLIERETETLVLSDLVEETVYPLGFANPAGFEAKQYEYKLTDLGRERVERLIAKYPEEAKTIDRVVDALLAHTGRLDQRVLSAAAKVDFIASQQDRSIDVPDVRLAAKDFGWELTDPQVDNVVDLLDKLGLAQVRR